MTTTPPNDFRFPRVAEILDREGIRLSRHKSQHFLHNHENCRAIARHCQLTPRHRVIEVGAGLGNLSVELARNAGAVVAVEMDRTFEKWHGELAEHFPNLAFHYADFLRVDIASVLPAEPAGPLVAAGNLPYQITGPILFKLIESPLPWKSIVLMVQLEVAERLTAGPRDRRAGALTYKLWFEYEARIAMKLGPREFIPPPRVDSAVVVITPRPGGRLVRDAAHKQRLHALVSAVFQHRRRTIANSLMLGGVVADRAASEAILDHARIGHKARPEEFELDDFLRLEEAVQAIAPRRGSEA